MNYPIVTRQPLAVVERSAWYKPWKSRGPGEVPTADAHHALIYKAHGQFIIDHGERTRRDQDVVAATHVTVVDCGRNVQVPITFVLPSRDGGSFDMVVTFSCTVNDPVQVVEDNLDAQQALNTYLRAYDDLFEITTGINASDLNGARAEVTAGIKAYTIAIPPKIPGLDVADTMSVEIRTPEFTSVHNEELQRLHQDQRKLRLTEDLENERKAAAARAERERRAAAQQAERESKAAEARAAREVRAEELRHAEGLSSDPLTPEQFRKLAYTKGEKSAGEFVDLDHRWTDEDRAAAAESARHEREFEEDRARYRAEQEAERARFHREELAKEAEFKRDQQGKDADVNRESRRLTEDAERFRERIRVEAQVDMLRELYRRGVGDFDNHLAIASNVLGIPEEKLRRQVVDRGSDVVPSLSAGSADAADSADPGEEDEAPIEDADRADDLTEVDG